jgi:hypothetical protein
LASARSSHILANYFAPLRKALGCSVTFRAKLMNHVDQEIFQILKETFRLKKKGELIDPDDLLAKGIIKWTLAASTLGIVIWIFLPLFGYEVPSMMKLIVGGPIGGFFGFLFLHLNNKVKNTSLILFVLTWFSMMFGYYF